MNIGKERDSKDFWFKNDLALKSKLMPFEILFSILNSKFYNSILKFL